MLQPRNPVSARAGITLTEVLVAVFVVSLGLMSLLTLFPLGAYNMAQAIKDERTAQMAANGEAAAKVFWKLAWEQNSYTGDPLISSMMTNPGSGLPAASTIGASYPVYVDPLGYSSYAGTPKTWLGGTAGSIPRATFSSINALSTAAAQRRVIMQWFALLDDITFGDQGLPSTANGATVEREGRYSCALLMRRPAAAYARVVELHVVVYANRPLQLNAALAPQEESRLAAPSYTITAAKGSKFVTITYPAGSKPGIRRNSWILDDQMVSGTLSDPHGYFYRVVDIRDTGATTVELELQTELRAATASLVVMDNVVEVFNKGTLRY